MRESVIEWVHVSLDLYGLWGLWGRLEGRLSSRESREVIRDQTPDIVLLCTQSTESLSLERVQVEVVPGATLGAGSGY